MILREEALALFEPYRDHFIALDQRGFVDVIDPDVLVDSPDVLVYPGDLIVDALHLEPHTPSVIVCGNLRVRDVLRQDFQAGALTVFGDVHAGAIASEGEIFAGGNIVADQLAYGCSPTRGMKSLGRLQTPWLVADRGYVFAPAGGLDAGVFIDLEGGSDELAEYRSALGAPVRLGRYFGAEVRAGAKFGGVAAICAKLTAGEALLPEGWSAPSQARPKPKAKKTSSKSKTKTKTVSAPKPKKRAPKAKAAPPKTAKTPKKPKARAKKAAGKRASK